MHSFLKKAVSALTVFLLSLVLLIPSGSAVFADESYERADISETAAVEEYTGEDTDHSTFSEEIIADVLERYDQTSNASMDNVVPGGDDPHKVVSGASLPYIGTAKVIAFHIIFPNSDPEHPDPVFPEGETVETLQTAIGPSTDGTEHPSSDTSQYSSLSTYYYASSYGKLQISGDAYEYHAQKTKAEYLKTAEPRETLYNEILAALDDQIDYTKYDGDGDGAIDCIYLECPYDPNDKWGSPFWPSCSVSFLGEKYDGVEVRSTVILNGSLNVENGRHTLIHESGHAMGFPDYYTYPDYRSGPEGENDLYGILNFDMMDSNIGDHNGFSKWLAGWLDENDITRVVANENGVAASRGGTPIQNNEDGSVTLDLASFDSDTIGETGGIIVVGSDNNAPFSSYYMIQYDTYAGNERVSYPSNAATAPLSSGFRVFRVQAGLNQYNTLIHSNTMDPIHNKLIELVDPDRMQMHSFSSTVTVASGKSDERYSCMFYQGMSLSPVVSEGVQSTTNFFENIDGGFTGITIEFLETGGSSGKLRISYSDEHKPVIKPFEVTLSEEEAIPGHYKLTLKASYAFTPSAHFNKYQIYARLDSNPAVMYYINDFVMSEDTITGNLIADTDLLKKDSKFILRINEDAFKLADGTASPMMEFDIPINQNLATLTSSGILDGTDTMQNVHIMTPIYKNEDGSYYYYEFANEHSYITQTTPIHIYTFTEETIGAPVCRTLENGSEEWTTARDRLNKELDTTATDRIGIVPENADLGNYPYKADAVRQGDFYYVLSYKYDLSTWDVDNQLAVSKLDTDGKLLAQVIPVTHNEVDQRPSVLVNKARIYAGPNDHVAVWLYPAIYNRNKDGSYSKNSVIWFYDSDLKLDSLSGGFSTGCGTWLSDGRFLIYGQRANNTMEMVEKGIERPGYICYDVTSVIDPAKDPGPAPGPGPDPKDDPGKIDTGDSQNILIWIVLMLAALSAGGMILLIRISGKKQR